MRTGTPRLGALTAVILASAIAGCSDDPPADTDAGDVDATAGDIGADAGATDLGTDAGPADTGVGDVPVATDMGAPTDATVDMDVASDVTETDAGADAGEMDVPAEMDVPTEMDLPVVVDVPVDVPAVDVPVVVDTPAPSDVPSTIPGAPALLTRNANFSTPLAIALNSAGTTAFFTARTPAGAPALFRSEGGTAAPTALAVSSVPLVFPTGMAISADDTRLFIADQAANRGGTAVGAEEGALLSVGVEGGGATAIDIGALRRPRAVAVHGNPAQLTFIASMDDYTPVVARVPAAGGTVTVLSMGGALRDPLAVAVASDGTAYVTDARADAGRGSVWRVVMGSAPVRVIGGLRMALPAGIALSRDERRLLVAGSNTGVGPGMVTWVGVDGIGPLSPASLGAPLVSPTGIARARSGDVFGIADDTATDAAGTSFGAVFTAR